jgi:arylsulfatase
MTVFLGLVTFMWLRTSPTHAQQTSTVPGTARQETGTPGSPNATSTVDGRFLPAPPLKFDGLTQLNASQSKPAWPMRVVPPKNAPNILLIMTDDVGFGAPSTFGGVIL